MIISKLCCKIWWWGRKRNCPSLWLWWNFKDCHDDFKMFSNGHQAKKLSFQ